MILLALLLLSPAAGHPMHTAVTQINYDAASGTADLQIRLFADDLAAATGDSDYSESAIQRYLAGKLSLFDRSGRFIPLLWKGLEPNGDVILIRLRATLFGGLSGARILSTILCERFADQVNVVRVSSGGQTSTLLFTKGDGQRVLRLSAASPRKPSIRLHRSFTRPALV